MPRPRKRSATALSLFPFLSILACIIGTLTLLITATAIGEIADPVDETLHAERLAENQEKRAEVSRLAKLADDTASLEAANAAAEAERSELATRRSELGHLPDRVRPLRAALTRAESRVDELRGQLEASLAEQSSLEDRYRRRRDRQERSPIALEPAGSGRNLVPHFIECRSDEIVLYDGPDRRPRQVPRTRIATSLELRDFLGRVRATREASAILLNRPSGVASCRAVEQQATLHRARHGRMPIPETGDLDFSRVPSTSGRR